MDELWSRLCCRRREPAGPPPKPDPDQWRFDLARSVGEECQTDAELWGVLRRARKFYKADFRCYDGFEPSGRMHIAQGVFKAVNVNKLTAAGGVFIFWVADWFALMNDKMGGDLEKIKAVGQYFIEVWKATGMDMSKVEFRWCSDDINAHAKEYWGQALDIARKTTLARVKKCCQIMGRGEDKLTAAQIMYPVLQSTDIFFLKADICQLGVDQRKVNMLARDYCDAVGRRKPVVLSHHMLYGLAPGQAKMSKSNPDSAIFMEDSAADIERKIRKAYCPTKPEGTRSQEADDMQLVKDDLMNPCLDYLQHILFGRPDYQFEAGGKVYKSFKDAKAAFLSGEISETVLKDRLVEEVNALVEPVRKHFAEDPFAKELLGKITQWKKETLAPVNNSATRLSPSPPFESPIFVVFAPRPTEIVPLEAVVSVLHRLRQAPIGSQRVLWLEDWTAGALNCIGAVDDAIRGFYDLLLHGLRGLAPELMDNVRVCWQGEMILSGPSCYWISAINAGRRCNLEQIRSSFAPDETLEIASQVFAALMHIADVLALTNAPGVVLCCDAQHENAHRLAVTQCEACGLTAPEVKAVAPLGLRLQPAGQGTVEADVNVLLTDAAPDVNRKLKKAFCMPGNTEACPPLAWAACLMDFSKELLIRRKPDDGGDKTYADHAALVDDFASSALHPGDLKPAIAKALNDLAEPLRADLKGKDALKKALKELDKHIKSRNAKDKD